MKTLVVEDTKTALAVVCHHLEKLGITPIPAHCGEEAIALFQSEAPDLVLLDVVLPDIDGFQVARSIREMERPGDWTPIIFLTAMSGDMDLERASPPGATIICKSPSATWCCEPRSGPCSASSRCASPWWSSPASWIRPIRN